MSIYLKTLLAIRQCWCVMVLYCIRSSEVIIGRNNCGVSRDGAHSLMCVCVCEVAGLHPLFCELVRTSLKAWALSGMDPPISKSLIRWFNDWPQTCGVVFCSHLERGDQRDGELIGYRWLMVKALCLLKWLPKDAVAGEHFHRSPICHCVCEIQF